MFVRHRILRLGPKGFVGTLEVPAKGWHPSMYRLVCLICAFSTLFDSVLPGECSYNPLSLLCTRHKAQRAEVLPLKRATQVMHLYFASRLH